MKNGNGTLSYRVGELEKSVEQINSRVYKIMTNELPHIQKQMAEMNNAVEGLKIRINVLTAVNVGAIILGAILVKIFSM